MDPNRPYFLSLGAGINQLPLIKAAADAGYQVITVDQNTIAKGNQFASVIIEESLSNYRKIYFKLMNGLFDSQLAGGACIGFGSTLLSWSYLAERLSLIAPSVTLMETLQDKLAIRNKLQDIVDPAFKQPLYIDFSVEGDYDIPHDFPFPAIMKPRKSHGKHSIFEFKTKDSFYAFIEQNDQTADLNLEDYMLEEKISGSEVILTGFVSQFNYQHIILTDKKASDQAPFIDLEHRFPSIHTEIESFLIKSVQQVVDSLQIEASPIVSEWLIQEGNIFLVEVSPQVAGEFIPQFLISEVLRYDYYQNLLSLALGKEIEQPTLSKFRKKSGSLKYITEPIENDKWEKLCKTAVFGNILNPNPENPAKSNLDRFAILGYKNK
jgi:hypothetical protein